MTGSDTEVAGAKLMAWLWDIWVKGGSLDGGDVQDYLLKAGLAKEVPFDPEEHGWNFDGADMMEPGDPFYVTTELGAQLLNLARV